MSFIAYQIKVSGAKDRGKNYIKVRPPLVRHLLRNRLLYLLKQRKAQFRKTLFRPQQGQSLT